MLAFWSCPEFREIYRREIAIARVQQSRIAVRRQSCPFSSIYYSPGFASRSVAARATIKNFS